MKLHNSNSSMTPSQHSSRDTTAAHGAIVIADFLCYPTNYYYAQGSSAHVTKIRASHAAIVAGSRVAQGEKGEAGRPVWRWMQTLGTPSLGHPIANVSYRELHSGTLPRHFAASWLFVVSY